ncbi:riboflavin synthase [Candidatus Kaiserbacteria bacterium]|nr:riboflavin synthase [Candidatus Kaiserbacteria bacterium]
MFTGIVEKRGEILSAKQKGMSRVIRVEKPASWILKKGQSIAVDGICSTVQKFGPRYFEVTYMPETLMRTIARGYVRGRVVNLERSLKLGSAVEGHLVQGHIDTQGKVVRVVPRGSSREVSIRISSRLMPFVARKGSISVNGVSLTVASLGKNIFTVALVPYTLEHTNLGGLKSGSEVNIETDMIARYLARLVNR